MLKKNSNSFPLKFFILFLSASLPFSFGHLGAIPDFLWIEIVGPILFAYGLFQIREGQTFFPYGSRIFVIAILVLVLWAIIHYCFNPVLSRRLMGVGKSDEGLRTYFMIFIGVCIFFYSLWFSCYWMRGENNWQRILTIVLWMSIIIGFARLITYILGFELPLLKANFDFGGDRMRSGQTTYRIGGISDVATLGISSLLGLYYQKRWSFKFLLLFISFVFLFFMSGGRAAACGVLAALLCFCSFIELKKAGWAFIFSIIIFGLVLTAFHYGLLESQYKRLSKVEGGFAQQDRYRYDAYRNMWRIFLDKPIMGKGIGYVSNRDNFVAGQLLGGGHGAYLSILMVFGIGGGFFLFVFLFVSIFRAFIAIKRNDITGKLDEDQIKMLIFILIILIILSFEFIAGGKGYYNTRLYLFAGILSGILSRRLNET